MDAWGHVHPHGPSGTIQYSTVLYHLVVIMEYEIAMAYDVINVICDAAVPTVDRGNRRTVKRRTNVVFSLAYVKNGFHHCHYCCCVAALINKDDMS